MASSRPEPCRSEFILLIENEGFDSGNLKGFLRQFGALYDQRLALYKPYDDRHPYLLGTRDDMVPRKKQVEFRTTLLPQYFRLIREHRSQIDVASMRFLMRKTFFNRAEVEY